MVSNLSVIGITVLVFAAAIASLRLLRANEQTPSVDDRINEAAAALKRVASLVEEMQSEMRVRSVALETLKVEHDDYQKLAAVRQDEAIAVSRLVDRAFARAGQRGRREQVLFFLAGVAVSIPIGFAINLLTR